jgi:hypothetical protein
VVKASSVAISVTDSSNPVTSETSALAILAFPPRLGRFQRQMCVERFAKMLSLDRVVGGLIKELRRTDGSSMIIFRLSTLYPILAHLSAHRFLHGHGAIRFRQLGDLREPRFAYRFPSLRWWLTVCSRAARPARLARSVSSTSTSTRRTPPPRHRSGLEVGVAIRDQVFRVGRPVEQDVLGDRS